jgi:hypothetical protein
MLLLATRFLVEIAGLVALGFIGATVPSETIARVGLGVGLPLALAIAWALVVAPKAGNDLPQRTRQIIGSTLLVGVAVALAITGLPGWGIALAAVTLADHALIVLLGLEDASATLGAIASEGGR